MYGMVTTNKAAKSRITIRNTNIPIAGFRSLELPRKTYKAMMEIIANMN